MFDWILEVFMTILFFLGLTAFALILMRLLAEGLCV